MWRHNKQVAKCDNLEKIFVAPHFDTFFVWRTKNVANKKCGAMGGATFRHLHIVAPSGAILQLD